MDIEIKITDNALDARELYKWLGIKHKFGDWINNSIRDYGFKEKEDFNYFFRKSTGGRPKKEYAISVNMAKELSMLAKSARGKQARKYFIKCEKIAKETYAERIALKKARMTFTDAIQESGENERMHGFAYSQYTKMVYKLAGIEYKKQDNFRDTLTADQLKRVKIIESMVRPLLELGKEYADIKDYIAPLFNQEKRIDNVK